MAIETTPEVETLQQEDVTTQPQQVDVQQQDLAMASPEETTVQKTEEVTAEIPQPEFAELEFPEPEPEPETTFDGPGKKIKKKELDDFAKKSASKDNYTIDDAIKDFPSIAADNELFSVYSKYDNTRLTNKYTEEQLAQRLKDKLGYEIEYEAADVGKPSPGGVSAAASGESQLPSSTKQEPISIDPKTLEAQKQKELKQSGIGKVPPYKYPTGYKNDAATGTVGVSDDFRKILNSYELSQERYKEGVEIIEEIKKTGNRPGQISDPRFNQLRGQVTEQENANLQNRKNNATKWEKEALPIINEIAKAWTGTGKYTQFLRYEYGKDYKTGEKYVDDYTLNNFKANAVARKQADALGIKGDFFVRALEREILAQADFQAQNAYAQEYFEKYELPKLKEKYPEVFSETALLQKFLETQTDDQILQKAQDEVFQESKKVQELQKAEFEPFKADYETQSAAIKDRFSQQTAMFEQEIKNLQIQVDGNAMSLADAQQREALLKEEYQNNQVAAKTELDGLWEKLTSIDNKMSTKYNRMLEANVAAIEKTTDDELNKAALKFAELRGGDPKIAEDFKAASKRAFEQNPFALRRAIKRTAEESKRSIDNNFTESLYSALGGTLSAYGTLFGAEWLRVAGDQIVSRQTITPARTEKFTDALDIFNLAKLSGQLVGVMGPSLAATMGASYITGGIAAPAAITATLQLTTGAIVGWSVNRSEMGARTFNDTFNETGSFVKAVDASEKMLKFQDGELIYHAFDALPFGGALKFARLLPKSAIGKGLLLGGISYGTELIQESRETAAEKAIRINQDPYAVISNMYKGTGKTVLSKTGLYDYGDDEARRAFDLGYYKIFKETAIATSPMFFGGAASNFASAKTEAYNRDLASKAGLELYQNSLIDEKLDYKSFRQGLSMITLTKGKDFATMMANIMFSNGQIEGREKLNIVLNTINASSELSQSPSVKKMSKEDKAVYILLADQYQNAVISLEEETDPVQKAAIEKKIGNLKGEMETFANTKSTNVLQMRLANGSVLLFTPNEIEELIDKAPEYAYYLSRGLATIAPLRGEATKAQKTAMEILTSKVSDYYQGQAPVTPLTIDEKSKPVTAEGTEQAAPNIPKFASFTEAQEYIESRMPSYASEEAFYSSKEYSDIYAQAKALFDSEIEITSVKTPDEALAILERKGFKVGEKVVLNTESNGQPVTYVGTVSLINGVPVVNLDPNTSTNAGEVVVPINDNWTKAGAESTVTAPTTEAAPTTITAPTITTEAAPTPTTTAPTAQAQQEKGEFSIQGTFDGLTQVLGSPENMIPDVQRGAVKREFSESNQNGKKIFTLRAPQLDNGGRAGYLAVSLVLPETTNKTINDVKGDLEKKLTEAQAAVDLSRNKGFPLELTFKKVGSEYVEAARAQPTETTTPTETTKPTEDAVQEQAAGQVPVQSEAGVSETMAQGKPQAEPQVAAEEGVQAEAEAKPKEELTEQERKMADFLDSQKAQEEQKPSETFNISNIDEGIARAKESKDKKLLKILTDAKGVMTALASANPSITIHYNQKTYTQAWSEAGGKEQESVNQGFYVSKDGSQIHINATLAESSNLVFHEGAHPVLDWLAQNRPEVIDRLFTELEGLSNILEGVQGAIDFGNNNYTGTQAKKEAIVEFMSRVADGQIKLPPQTTSLFKKIVDFINNLLNSIGIDFGVTITTQDSVVDVARKFTDSVTQGKQLDVKVSEAMEPQAMAKIKESGYGPYDTIFNKPELKNNTNYGWRSMGEGEFNELIVGNKTYEGGSPRQGNWISGNPESASEHSGAGKILVEFGNIDIVGGESMSKGSKADKTNVTKVWKYNNSSKKFEDAPELLEKLRNSEKIEESYQSKLGKTMSDLNNAVNDFYDYELPALKKAFPSDDVFQSYNDYIQYSKFEDTYSLLNPKQKDIIDNINSREEQINSIEELISKLDEKEITLDNAIKEYNKIKQEKPSDMAAGPQAMAATGGTNTKQQILSDIATIKNQFPDATAQEINNVLLYKGYTQQQINEATLLSGVSAPEVEAAPPGGGKQRVSAIYERIAQKAENEGRTEEAQAIRERGKYFQRKTETSIADAQEIVDQIGAKEAYESFKNDGSIAPDVKGIIYAMYIKELNDAITSSPDMPSQQMVDERNNALYELANYARSLGRGVNIFKEIYKLMPELFYELEIERVVQDTTESLGDPDVVGTRANSVKKVQRVGLPRFRKNFFEDIGRYFAGEITYEQLIGDDSKFDNKVKEALKILLSYGKDLSPDKQNQLSSLLKGLSEKGIFGMAETREEILPKLSAEINDVNGKIKFPLTPEQVSEFADSLLTFYEGLAEQKLSDLLAKEFNKNPSDQNLKAAVKAIMYGALETPESTMKFAQMFNLPFLTTAQLSQLRGMAKQLANAKGSIAQQQANARFSNQMSKFQLMNKSAVQKIWAGVKGSLKIIETAIYNWTLARLNTMAKIIQGNIFRLVERTGFGFARAIVIGGGIRNVTDSYKATFTKREVENVFTYTDSTGVTHTIKISNKINETVDNVYSSLRGVPRLSDIQRSGLNDMEILIRELSASSSAIDKVKRRAVRGLIVPASRLMGALDSLTSPTYAAITKRQLYYEIIKNQFPKDIKPIEISNAVEMIMSPSDTVIAQAMEQARLDIINTSLLYKDLGYSPTGEDFPLMDKRFGLKSMTGNDAKIYNEWLLRVREILDSTEYQRLKESAQTKGWMSGMTDAEAMATFSAVDEYVAKVTSESVFLGTPRGTIGMIIQPINNLIEKYLIGKALKLTGLLPLFLNAGGNFVGGAVRITPGLNAIQYFKYLYMGTRGFKKEFKSKEAVKLDQAQMLYTVIVTNTLAAIAFSLRGDDDKEKRQNSIIKKIYTGITPMRINQAQEKLGYKPGYIYINGKPYIEYRDNTFGPFIGFIGYLLDGDIWNTNPMSDKMFPENEKETYESMNEEDRKFSIGNYLLYVGMVYGEGSQIREMSNTFYDLMKAIKPDQSEDEEIQSAKILKQISTRKFANALKLAIPYGGLSGEAKQLYDALTGRDKKLAIDFYDMVVIGTALEDIVIKTNGYDFWGKPVKDKFKIASPFGGSLSIGESYPEKPEMELYRKNNYSPRLVMNEYVLVTVNQSELMGGEKEFGELVQRTRAQIKAEDKDWAIREMPEMKNEDPRITVEMPLSKQQANQVNKASCDFVGKFYEYDSDKTDGFTNLALLNGMDKLAFRKCMDDLYRIGKTVKIYEMANELSLAPEDRRDYWNMIYGMIEQFKSKYCTSATYNLMYPKDMDAEELIGVNPPN